MNTIKYPFLDLSPVNKPFEDELKNAACKVVASGRYLHGDNAAKLEHDIASLCHSTYAIAVSNGLDALRLIIRAYKELGIFHEGDNIIVPANTFIASALAISDAGLVPQIIDISAETLNIDTSQIERRITANTVGIMPVHLYGTPCWDEQLMNISQKYGLKIIEDNAQAIGAQAAIEGINGTKNTGALGDAAGISFYPTKNLGALGDAGMVTTCDKQLAETVSAIANYGADSRYHNIYCGYNCRMDELQAALLLVKLPHLEAENNRRRNLAALYNSNINNPLITTPAIFNSMRQVWHQYPLRVKNRANFIDYMRRNGIETDIIYPTPIHRQPCYKSLAHNGQSFPEAEKFAAEIVCLPIGAHISLDNAQEIGEIANQFHV